MVGKFAVCPEHAVIAWPEVVREELASHDAATAQRVVDSFPFPIAYGYARTLQPDNAATAVKNMLYTYTATLRFATLTLLAQFLHSDLQAPRVTKAVRRLQVPHLNDWFNAATTLARSLFPLPRGRGRKAMPGYAEGGPFCEPLARAVHSFRRLRVGGQPCHETLLRFRNHFDGHGGTWSEDECRQQMEQPLLLLERVLSRFECLAEIELLQRTESGGALRLVGASPSAEEIDVLDPALEDALEASEMVLRYRDNLLPLEPLLCAPDASDHPDERVLAFDGHGPKRMSYVGVCSRTEKGMPLHRYRKLLSAKNIDPRFSKRDLRPWIITEWARETTTVKVDNLRSVKYYPSFYQERLTRIAGPTGQVSASGVEDIISSWIAEGSESALLVAAEAGSGKTSLLCHLARKQLVERVDRRLAPSPDCVLLVLGSSVRGGGQHGQLFERIRDGLGFSEGGLSGLNELLEAWIKVGDAEDLEHERRRLVLLVDAVNEAEDPKAVFEEVSELAAAAATANRKVGWNFVRLVLSVRLERIETLLHRWSAEHDTPFFQHPENFAHFRDDREHLLPYLVLRRFTHEEASRAYGRCARSLMNACPAAWDELAPPTRELLRHPLMLMLFHRAFADNAMPPAVGAEETLWNTFLDRTFDVRRGGTGLERLALDLADACIDAGESSIPATLAARWRDQWLARQGNDPVRIAALLDPLERLSEAGLLHRIGEELDWISAPLAEHVFFRALRRRDPELSAESLTAWLELPRGDHLEGALIHAGVHILELGQSPRLAVILARDEERARTLVGESLCRVAPRGAPEDIADDVQRFAASLDALLDTALQDAGEALASRLHILADILTWEVWGVLRHKQGTVPVSHVVLPRTIALAQRLVELDPDDLDALRRLSLAFSWMTELVGRSDPRDARSWMEKTLTLRQKLVDKQPNDPTLLRDLAITLAQMGGQVRSGEPDAARSWYEKSLEITQKLLESAPDDRRYLRDLQITTSAMGSLLARRDVEAAVLWHERALAIAERLVAMEPNNRAFLRDLAIDYSRLGGIASRRDPTAALQWFERALEITEQLVEREPDNVRYLRDLVIASNRLGSLCRRNDPEGARSWYTRALEITERLIAMEPENTAYLRDLALVHGRLGSLDREHPERARVFYERAFQLNEKLVALQPHNLRDRHSLSITCTQLGDLLIDSALEEARPYFERALGIMESLVEQEPRNRAYLRSLSMCFNRMGDLEADAAPENAVGWYLKALEIRRGLVQREPRNGAYLNSLARSYARLGELASRDRTDEAITWFERALEVSEELVELEPTNVWYLAELARALGELSELQKNTDAELAWRFAHRAVQVFRQALEHAPDDPALRRGLVEALLRHGQSDEAASTFLDAVDANLLSLSEVQSRDIFHPLAEHNDVQERLQEAPAS